MTREPDNTTPLGETSVLGVDRARLLRRTAPFSAICPGTKRSNLAPELKPSVPGTHEKSLENKPADRYSLFPSRARSGSPFMPPTPPIPTAPSSPASPPQPRAHGRCPAVAPPAFVGHERDTRGPWRPGHLALHRARPWPSQGLANAGAHALLD